MQSRMRLFLCKILQRRIYDLFSNKQSLLLCFAFICLTLISVLHLLEVALVRNQQSFNRINSKIPYNKVHESYSCHNFPIDAVYTWVNGSDSVLLEQLLKTKKEMQHLISSSDCSEKICKSSEECIETPIVFIRPIVKNPYQIFDNVTKFENFKDKGSLIYFSSVSTAREQTLRCFISYNTTTYSLSRTHIILGKEKNTIDSHTRNDVAISVSSLILLHGIPDNTTTKSNLLRYLSPFARKQVDIINIYDDKKIALLSIKNSLLDVSKVLQALKVRLDKYSRIFGLSIKIWHPIDLMLGNDKILTQNDIIDDMSESRFADNQELRFSLRSLEKNAHWIRNIYIVTNGQIPYWLNLENPRIKIITHEEIFLNKSHLPTFSSPAIETHLHRIPNLSKKFLYINDDILFGKPVYPEDFFTESKGYKVYLSWPVPNCAEGCPMNWLKDGYCDQACNTSACLWDGGDCDSDKVNIQNLNNNLRPIANSRNRFDRRYPDNSQAKSSDEYCSPNCVDNWLSDKFCDQVCNNKECGFDLGDCGTQNYYLLYSITFYRNINTYYFPTDVLAIYFNLTLFVSNSNLEITEINYENNTFVRSSAMNMNHKTLMFVFYPNREKTNITIILKGLQKNSEFITRIEALPSYDTKLNISNGTQQNFIIDQSIEEEKHSITESYLFTTNSTYKTVSKTIQLQNRYPKLLPVSEIESNWSLPCQFNVSALPLQLQLKFEELNLKLKNGLLTEKGLKNFRRRLIQLYINHLCNFETTVKAFDNSISSFKWEKQSTFANIEKYISSIEVYHKVEDRVITRHLMDSYADSLRHVNQLYNQVFGIEMRKVPAHMSHFIDVDIMTRLQNTFAQHFDITSSHKIRSSNDMQFAFAYNYFLMSDLKPINLSDIFDNFDVDNTGTWSHHEIRTVMINIYDLPLKKETVEEFYQMISFCCNSSDLCSDVKQNFNVSQYDYRGFKERQSLEIPRSVILNCENVTNKLSKRYDSMKANKFEVVGEEEVSFKMIKSNTTILAKELDELNKHPKKFMCLNDNIEHKEKIDVRLIKEMLVQFYESMFPNRSQFELPLNKRNKFAYIHQYYQSHNKQMLTKVNAYILWLLLLLLTLLLCISFKKKKFIPRIRNIFLINYLAKPEKKSIV